MSDHIVSNFAVVGPPVWPALKGTSTKISYSFLKKGGTDGQKQAVRNAMNEWQKYANVEFVDATNDSQATIRVDFEKGQGSWSMAGTEAKLVEAGQATMNLGWLPARTDCQTPEDIGIVLRELGHVLGLCYEHQSPARGGDLHLNSGAVYHYYLPKFNNDVQFVKKPVIDTHNEGEVEAFSRLNFESIMMYPMDARLNEEGMTVPPSVALCELPALLNPRQALLRKMSKVEITGRLE